MRTLLLALAIMFGFVLSESQGQVIRGYNVLGPSYYRGHYYNPRIYGGYGRIYIPRGRNYRRLYHNPFPTPFIQYGYQPSIYIY